MGFFVESFLTIYLKSAAGFDAGLAALLMVLYGMGGSITALFSGPVIDRFGPTIPLVVSLVLTASAAIILALNPPTWMLAGVVLVIGAVGQVIMPATNAQVAELVPEALHRKAFSLVYISLNSGLAFGPLIGGMLANVSFTTMFLTGAALIIGGAVLIVLSHRGTLLTLLSRGDGHGRAHENRLIGLKTAFQDAMFIRFNIMNWLFMGLYVQVFVILPLFMLRDGLSVKDYGVVMAINGTMLVLLQLPVDRFVRRFQPARLLTASAVLLAVGLTLNVFANTLWAYLLAAAFWTAAELVNIPLAASVTVALSTSTRRGSYLAVHGVAFPMGFAIASLFGGSAFFMLQNPKLIWLILAGVGLVLACLRHRQETPLSQRLQR